MSTFEVRIKKIATVEPHPNADRLDLVTVEGMDWTLISGKDYLKVGDKVVFFPIDSQLPLWLVEKLNLVDKLEKGAPGIDGLRIKNRVKTKKLRGVFSQGLVDKIEAIAPDELTLWFMNELPVDSAVTELLSVTKYEPPADNEVQWGKASRAGHLKKLPDWVSKYDIEGASNYMREVEELMDFEVYVSEKLEGSHWGATVFGDDNTVIVFQRNFSIQLEEGSDLPHTWIETFEKLGLRETLIKIKETKGAEQVTVRGEILGPGIQKNYYQLSAHTIYVFEIELNGKPVDSTVFLELVKEHGIQAVPVLAQGITLREYLNGASVKEVSNGKTVLVDKDLLREGIVIKPMQERFSRALGGRFFLKMRSPQYLDKTDF
jgi:RNA ligase (TIGR02306 family)